MTLRELCEPMIIVSSNFAANLLIEQARRREHQERQ